MAKILKKSDYGKTRATTLFYSINALQCHFRQKEKKLDEWDWKSQATEPIGYKFGVLFNGKKTACLQNGFKMCHTYVGRFCS